MTLAELKAIAWAVLEIGLIPTVAVVLIVHFLRQVHDLRRQNEKLVDILERNNEKNLELVRRIIELNEGRTGRDEG